MLGRVPQDFTTCCCFLQKVGEKLCFYADFKDCNLKNSPI